MHFKKVALLSGFTLLAGSIVVPAGSSVNRHTTSAHDNGWQDADGDGGWNAATTAATHRKKHTFRRYAATSIAARRWRVLGRWDAIATAATRSGGVIGQARKKCSNWGIEVI